MPIAVFLLHFDILYFEYKFTLTNAVMMRERNIIHYLILKNEKSAAIV